MAEMDRRERSIITLLHRSNVMEEAVVTKTPKPKRQILKHKKKILLLLVIGVLAFVAVLGYLLTTKEEPVKSEAIITYSTDKPDESKANADNYAWNGAPDEPKKIRISNLSIDAFVQKAGVDQDKRIAVPTNVHLASWFADSQKPGQNGLSIIAGHVSGPTVDGVFKKLGSLEKGSKFEIELGNGDIKKYKVIAKKQLKEAESASFLFSQDPKVKSQVNLITCGGNFNKEIDQYEDRIILSGELQP